MTNSYNYFSTVQCIMIKMFWEVGLGVENIVMKRFLLI